MAGLSLRWSRLLGPLLVVLLGAGCVPPDWMVRPDDGKKKKVKVSYTVNRKAYKHLDRAQKALAEKDYEAAKEELDDMQSRSKRFNPYELALMWQTYAHMYADQEDMQGAADSLEKALVEDVLPEGATVDAMFNLGSLQLATEQFDKAAGTFTRWLELAGEKATPQARFTVGVAFAQAKKWDEALEQATLAVDAKDDPPESWLQLLMSVQFERGEMPAVEELLKRLLVRYPRKGYWQQLAGVYAERKDDARALAVLELMYAQGILESREEVIRLAQMLMFHGVPTKATSVLTVGLDGGVLERDEKTLELLASSYLYARESDDAKGVLAEAARKSEVGKLYVQLGRQHMRDAEWDRAATAVRRGIAKGGLSKVGNAWLLLGSIYFNAERWTDARDAFQKAKNFAESRGTAGKWLDAVEQQILAAQAQASN